MTCYNFYSKILETWPLFCCTVEKEELLSKVLHKILASLSTTSILTLNRKLENWTLEILYAQIHTEFSCLSCDTGWQDRTQYSLFLIFCSVLIQWSKKSIHSISGKLWVESATLWIQLKGASSDPTPYSRLNSTPAAYDKSGCRIMLWIINCYAPEKLLIPLAFHSPITLIHTLYFIVN